MYANVIKHVVHLNYLSYVKYKDGFLLIGRSMTYNTQYSEIKIMCLVLLSGMSFKNSSNSLKKLFNQAQPRGLFWNHCKLWSPGVEFWPAWTPKGLDRAKGKNFNSAFVLLKIWHVLEFYYLKNMEHWRRSYKAADQIFISAHELLDLCPVHLIDFWSVYSLICYSTLYTPSRIMLMP